MHGLFTNPACLSTKENSFVKYRDNVLLPRNLFYCSQMVNSSSMSGPQRHDHKGHKDFFLCRQVWENSWLVWVDVLDCPAMNRELFQGVVVFIFSLFVRLLFFSDFPGLKYVDILAVFGDILTNSKIFGTNLSTYRYPTPYHNVLKSFLVFYL